MAKRIRTMLRAGDVRKWATRVSSPLSKAAILSLINNQPCEADTLKQLNVRDQSLNHGSALSALEDKERSK